MHKIADWAIEILRKLASIWLTCWDHRAYRLLT